MRPMSNKLTEFTLKNDSPKYVLNKVKQVIPFLSSSLFSSFWENWQDLISTNEEWKKEVIIILNSKINWIRGKIIDDKNTILQLMVDWLWNTGARDSDLDRLGDTGALINPHKLGCWIEISQLGGMDNGWFFPVTMPLSDALLAIDILGRSTSLLQSWAKEYRLTECQYLSSNKGLSPSHKRHTELHFQLKNFSFQKQIEMIKSAFSSFNLCAAEIPEEFMHILHMDNPAVMTGGGRSLVLTMILTGDDFVKLGIMLPEPTIEQVLFISNTIGNIEFEKTMKVKPYFIEGVLLNQGFGYDKYNEGWNVFFHYQLSKSSHSFSYLDIAPLWPSSHHYLDHLCGDAIMELHLMCSTGKVFAQRLPSDLLKLIIYWLIIYWPGHY